MKTKIASMKCYDCGTEIDDYVMETRQTSGGDGVTFAGDFREVPVHSDRRRCQEIRKQQRIVEEREGLVRSIKRAEKDLAAARTRLELFDVETR